MPRLSAYDTKHVSFGGGAKRLLLISREMCTFLMRCTVTAGFHSMEGHCYLYDILTRAETFTQSIRNNTITVSINHRISIQALTVRTTLYPWVSKGRLAALKIAHVKAWQE